MSRIRFRAAALVATLALVSACSGLKDALTAHVDTVARAGGQELTVQRLSQMMADAKAPARKDVAQAITNIWVNYELLGEAAANGDSLASQKDIDEGMWAQVAQIKLKKLFAAIQKSSPAIDSASFESHYNNGDMLAAKHILIAAAKGKVKPAEMEAARKQAESIAKQATPANFAALAKKYSADPGTKNNGGDLGVFQKGSMVPEFQAGVLSLKPGQISGPVQSDYGYHIIMRETWPEAKAEFSKAYAGLAQQSAESTYSTNLEHSANISLKPDAAKTVRAIAADLDAYRTDHTAIATSKNVDMTADKVAKWMAAYPPQTQIREKLQQLPDSVMGLFVKQLITNEMMLKAADSAKITLDSTDKANLRRVFVSSVWNAYGGLGIVPASLADSGKTVAAREKIAGARIDKFMEALLSNKAQFVDVAEPVALALHDKFESRVMPAGIDRAVTAAQKATASADSAAAKNMPQSAVPAPGAPSAGAVSAPPATKKP
ncbi:MAG TPA: peptidylprolyl isomerase [Gemmatimonadaceae bacterium]|jgi:peptidyl-prolyl cis-trans isomerase D